MISHVGLEESEEAEVEVKAAEADILMTVDHQDRA
jgi:hypothetical protein